MLLKENHQFYCCPLLTAVPELVSQVDQNGQIAVTRGLWTDLVLTQLIAHANELILCIKNVC